MSGGDALLIAGHTTEDSDPRLPLVTQLGEALLASASPWRVRRLAAGGPDRDAPSRGNVRREFDAMLDRPASARLVVVAAELARTIEGLGVVCGGESAFREDVSVSLEWFAARLQRASNVPTVFLIVAPPSGLDRRACLDVLGTSASEHVIAIATGDPLAMLQVMIDGLWSDAIDLATGSITPRSLGSYLQARLPEAALQPSASIATLLEPRGLVRVDLAERAHHRVDAGNDELIGAVLPGQYRVVSELGRGNFAVVYRAHHAALDREVAIKVFPVQHDADAIRQFQLEIRALKLDHRNVVRVWHADMTRDGRMFVAMELLAGSTLQQVIARGAVTPELALKLTRQLLAGLGAAHAAGIIHADVKPANAILVDGDDPRVVLLDFGFACLRAEHAVSVGGTPAFMAPEQFEGAHIEASVDLYATALVALALVSGCQAVADHERAGAIALFPDAGVRAVLARALQINPAERFASAIEMLAELDGASTEVPPPRPAFRVAAPFSERERDDFHGRIHEVERLLEHVLFHRAVVYVAPSGTGKTSLLLAGLIPRLRDLDLDVVYVPCRAGISSNLAFRAAIAERLETPSMRKLILIIDQVETALVSREDGDAVLEALGMSAWPADVPISVIWSVREEYLARLLDRVKRIEPGIPILRLGPLMPQVAAEIIRVTFQRRGVTVAPALLDQLVADLASAAAKLSLELGWGDVPAVYPPHLQLAGAVLDLERRDHTLDLELYQDIGGFQTILEKHLQRVLQGELGERETAIARDVLVTLMTSSRTQVACEERELFARVGDQARSPEEIASVLRFLRDRGLLVSRGASGEPVWDLAHDSLAAQIEAWITTTDAARRRAMDLVRHHLQRSTSEHPSRLGVGELREIRDQLDARDIAALDDEWERRLGVGDRPATRLLATSRSAIKYRRGAFVAFALTAAVCIGVFATRWLDGKHEIYLRDRDIGETHLVLRAFDWDPVTLAATDVADADLDWELVRPAAQDQDLPGRRFGDEDLSSEPLPAPPSAVRADSISAPGGPAVLIVSRRNATGMPCAPVIVPIRQLPGYNQSTELSLRIPTCEASAADLIPVEAGPFLAHGAGLPPSPMMQDGGAAERTVELPNYALDRTEVPNALLTTMSEALAASGRRLPIYPKTPQLAFADLPDHPVGSLTWQEAALVCRMLGKRLPTSIEWQKAARGGMMLDHTPNPFPRRNLPWGLEVDLARANVNNGKATSPAPVGSHPRDIGPYGHLDLAGNVSEWTSTLQPDGSAIMRGGNWDDAPGTFVDFCAIENPRPPRFSMYTIGFRCASDLSAGELREILSQRARRRDVEINSSVVPRPQPQ